MNKGASVLKENLVLLVIAVVLALFPLFYLAGTGAEFEGADGKAMEEIEALNPEYEPWYEPFWEPSGETESLLFALQAALGAGIIFYTFGYWKGLLKGRQETKGKLS